MAESSRASIVLTASCALVAGLAGGWGLGQLGGEDPPVVLAVGPAAAGAEAGAVQELAPAAPPPPAARPGGNRVEMPTGSAAGEPAASAETPGSPGQPVAAPPESLLEELRHYLSSGSFEAQIVEQGWDIEQFLVYQYVQAGDAHRALDLLRRHPSEDADLYTSVAQALEQAGDRDGAARIWLEALERQPFDAGVLGRLRELDPAAALATLDQKLAEVGLGGDIGLGMERARLLHAQGQTQEALALVRAALAEGTLDETALDALAEIDPAEAERVLRERAGVDPSGEATMRLARLLGDSERSEESARLLEGLLQADPSRGDALEMLFSVQPESALAWLGSPAAEEVDPYLWGRVGDLLAERGQTAEAVEAWMRLASWDMSDWDSIDRLREHAPGRLWAHCAEATADTRDDELLGDVADIYWRDGRRDEAVQLWRRASRIDPGDGEWSGKLRQVALGNDPL